MSSPVRIHPNRTECIDAASATTSNPEALEDINLDLVQKIAIHCRDILFGKKLIWNGNYSPSAYREAALQRGITKVPGMFSPTKFTAEFVSHYGIHLLKLLGITETNKMTWVSNIFQENLKQVFHPIEHILVQLFLESLPTVSTAHPFGRGPWRCPNPYGLHTEEFPIKKIVMRRRSNDTCYGRARCSCGFSFTTTGIDATTLRMPAVDSVSSFGPSRYHFAQKLLQAGSSLKETAKALGVQLSHLKLILETNWSESEAGQAKVLAARHEWLELLKQDPHRRVTVARKKRYGLYQFLRKHDKEWVLGQKEPQKLRVDWQKRDLEWSTLIANTLRRLGEGAPKTVVAREAGLNLKIFSQLDRLPLCAAALKNNSPHLATVT